MIFSGIIKDVSLNNELADTVTRCFHCGDYCTSTQLSIGDKSFCCQGCKLVFELLNENDLCTYYNLNQHPGSQQLQQKRKNKFAYLENEEVISNLIKFDDGNQCHITFSVPQIHCSSCLWLLERLDSLQSGILTTRVNFALKEVFVVFDKHQTSLREVVETMSAIGYEPYLSLNASSESKDKKGYTRVTEIAIAGFCFANIMMLSLPEYFSVFGYLQEKTGTAFRYIGFILALPVFFYCSREFFANAYSSVKTKYLNIDASVALAILLTFLRSLYNLFILDGNTYFDSMSGIVFFMLVGRWAQDRTQRSLVFDRDYKSFFPIAVNVKRNDSVEPVLISALKEKDIIEVYDHEIIPADSILAKGKAVIDYSFITGESIPRHIESGALVYAGGKQLGEKIELMVLKKSDQGYLTNLWNKEGKSQTNNLFLHRASNYFTIIVFILTFASAAYWLSKGQPNTMWNALTTTLIIACPCALLLASTFTNGNMMRILSRSGLFLKNAEVINDMAKINHIVLDKTGTITLNKHFKINYKGKSLSQYENTITASLLKHSTHPLSKSVFEHLKVNTLIAVESFSNKPGKGIEGWVDDHHIKIGSKEFVQQSQAETLSSPVSQVFVWIDGVVLGVFELQNIYRPGLFNMLQQIRSHFKLSILSGDNNAEYDRLSQMTGSDTEIRFDQSPEDKYNYINLLQKNGATVLMAGDGLNDAGALRKSNVGIAIMEGSNSFTPAADGIISASAFTQLNAMLSFSKKAKLIINISFIVSILYNIVGLFFALQGLLAPVIAAILMPASTISIIFITFAAAEWHGRKLLRLKS